MPHDRAPCRSRYRARFVWAWLGALAGCSGTEEEELSLLRGRPDALVAQHGVIEPSSAQWSAAARLGWETKAEARYRGGALPHVWSRDKVASLDLASATPREREIALTVFGPPTPGGRPRTLVVRLNGIALGDVELTDEPAEQRLAAPASAWRAGENLLELEVDGRRALADNRHVGFAVARVAYDHPAAVEMAPDGRVVLAPGTSVAYHFEGRGPARLDFAGTAASRGRVLVRLDEVDPESGVVRGERFSLALELADDRIERAVPVPALTGTYARLELSWSSEDESSRFTLDALTRREARPPQRIGVVLLSVDTLAARNLPFYGYARDTAPRLRELAAESVVFEDCRTNAPWTVPSYMSQFTGLYADAHRLPNKETGNAAPEIWEQWHLADNRWTLAELFQAAGYDTAAFVDHQWFTNEFGFAQGFDVFDDEAFRVPKVAPAGGARLVTKKALDWLAERTDGHPFFLFMHFLDVHGPYCGQPEDEGRFAGDELYDEARRAPIGGSSPALNSIHDYLLKHNEYADTRPPAWVPTAAFAEDYDEGIVALDRAIGAFLDELEVRGLLDSTLIVLSADHGETMDDSDLLFGHGSLDEAVLGVPLLVRFPDGRGKGKRVAARVQLVDLYATLVDVLGLPPRPYLHGSSLLPLVDGLEEPGRVAYVEGGLASQRCVVRDGWKLVQRNLALESAPAHLLTQPGLERLWNECILPRERANGRDGAQLDAAERVAAALFERMRAEGMHVQLRRDFEAQPGYPDVLRLVRRHFDREELLLYDLESDPGARVDVAARHPEKVAELLAVLEAEQRRMQRAREMARLPTEPVRLDERAIDDLRKLGYSE